MPFELVELSKIADSELDNLPNKPYILKISKASNMQQKIHFHFLLTKNI